eukprot:GEMP01062218.1.p1 GENE.GEMP01062218.1~~GEMP01062218.1.p1  ORF type:complete len:184 (+),score=35.52 GEMP01062218.1:145-696(+)
MAPSDWKPADIDWRENWVADQVKHASPRWTFRGPGNKQGQWRRRVVRAKLHQAREPKPTERDTFLDQYIRLSSWKPGPGTHKTSVEFVNWKKENDREKDEDRAGNSVKFDGPNYSVPKMMRTQSSPNHKFIKKNYARSDFPSSFYTPGPGHYKTITTFGMPSGPSRESFFGKVETRWRAKSVG